MTNTLTDLTLTGDLTLGGNNIAMTGNVAAPGARAANGWFVNLDVSNPIQGAITGNAATVTTNANLTGPITSVGNATALASQTGTGSKIVVDASPTIVSPNIAVINAPGTDGVVVQGRTNGAAIAAGYIGETLASPMPASGDNMASAVTVSTGGPAVITYNGHGLSTGAGVNFTTTGSLPSGMSVGVNYYVVRIDNNSFWIANSVANAFSGNKISTSGSQSGTHTCNVSIICANAVYADANGLLLPAGLWAVNGSVSATGSANLTAFSGQITTTSGTSLPFGNTGFVYANISTSAGGGLEFPTGTRIFNIASPTLIIGIVRASFSSGNAKGSCSLIAHRIA